MESGLYVVATPIGNLGDMVPRALDVLQAVDLIAAEDTRHSAVLLRHFGIDTPMLAYHDHSDGGALARLSACIECQVKTRLYNRNSPPARKAILAHSQPIPAQRP